MAKRRKEVTEAELAVLKLLWDEGPQTIRQLTDALYPDGTTSSYATVQKLLERLEAKSCVGRRRGKGAHSFHAKVEREELIGSQLRSVADRMCGGSLTPLLTQLVEMGKVSASERQALRELIERMDRKKPKGEAKP